MAPGSGRHRSTATTIARAAFTKNRVYSAQYKRKFLADHDAKIQQEFQLKLALFLSIWQACDARNMLVADSQTRNSILCQFLGQQTAELLYRWCYVPWTSPVYPGSRHIPYATFDALYWQQTFGLRDRAHFDILVAAFGIDDDHVYRFVTASWHGWLSCTTQVACMTFALAYGSTGSTVASRQPSTALRPA